MVKNVLGTALQTCCTNPLTGFYRDGKCNTGPEDIGKHTICVQVNDEFLRHQASIGNDLITPRPEFGFPGLKAGEHWCAASSYGRSHMTPVLSVRRVWKRLTKRRSKLFRSTCCYRARALIIRARIDEAPLG